MGHWHTNESHNLGQKTRPYNNQQKKKICKIIHFAVPADQRMKLKEREKGDKYLDVARELKKTMEHESDDCTNCALGTVTKGLLKGLEDLEVGGQVETIQTTALLKTVRIQSTVLELEETCCHSISSERPSANADVKNSKGVNNNKHICINIFSSNYSF